jgi:hypothetical protein
MWLPPQVQHFNCSLEVEQPPEGCEEDKVSEVETDQNCIGDLMKQ